MALIDISPAISPRLAVWPGDVGFRREVALDMARGDNLTLSSITATVHLGAHADAPSHYARDGEDIAARDLDRYFGDCQVLRVSLPRGARITPEHIRAPITAPRVLLHTGSFPDPESWNTDFNSLSAALVRWLHERGVGLVGIDTPSTTSCWRATMRWPGWTWPCWRGWCSPTSPPATTGWSPSP